MKPRTLDVLVISDLHYIGAARYACDVEARKCQWGALFLRKALLRLEHSGIKVNAIVLLGDLVDNGLAPGVEQDLEAVASVARTAGVPVLAVPGNHDGRLARVAKLFGCPPGLYEIGGYGFLLFHDDISPGDVTTRPTEGLDLPRRAAESRPGLPLIALQHNPLHPQIESEYPYMPTNTAAILQSYAESGVLLSLSGHFHPGQPQSVSDKVTYYTVPAVCEAPFAFAHLRLKGHAFELREHRLQLEQPGLWDAHCHTEYAYCGTTVNARRNIELAQALGLEGLCLTEHAFQLYFNNEVAWSYRWQTDPRVVRRAYAGDRARMREYREFAESLRDRFVRLGLEVELCTDGQLLLAKEDAKGWDLLIGAVHQIPNFDQDRTARADAERLFLRETQRLLEHPIQVLAHPFRFFRRAGRDRPKHLYPEVAEMLAQRGVAAEVNFHTNTPDPEFVRVCLDRGVKIALATDSHDLAEVGELYPHLEVLRQAGVRDADLPGILFTPAARRTR